MDNDDLYDMFEDLAEDDLLETIPRIKKAPLIRSASWRVPKPKASRTQDAFLAELAAEEDLSALDFTYQPSRTEAGWLADSLGYFFQNRWIDDVLRLVKGGKEASVYLCAANLSAGLPYLAAKVYRPRRFRNLRNDHLYREDRDPLDDDGNVIIDEGKLHAMSKRSAYGQRLNHTSWIAHELRALQILSGAGVAVPKPYASGHNAILMTYLGDSQLAAPTLNSVRLERAEAQTLFDHLLADLSRMLAVGLVHGDLSAYNLLYWEGEITLIDFPQAISPNRNRNAYQIFRRDLVRVCDYFTRQGVEANPRDLARELWSQHGLRRTPDIHPGLLDDQDPDDRAYWERMT